MEENKKQTIMAFVRLACSLVAGGAALFGVAVDAEALFVGATCVVAFAAYIWSWWKNNNVTKAATEAQEVLDLIKMQDGYAFDPSELEEEEAEING